FKPFNDVYGYRRGDDIIQLTARVIAMHCDPNRDFVGHIGGDDFIVLFQSGDWETRCRAILDEFHRVSAACFSAADRERGGFVSEDRRGNTVLHPLASLSIGAVRVEPGQYLSHHQIATAAADAKKEAKKISGDSLFIERRHAGLAPLSRNE
ncbi:MAG TPA: diguanylate cyclase, partial [Noviherbaspirillum sp.]|nr:diguanylate cyclase [Noviherbaspirillum sp.]